MRNKFQYSSYHHSCNIFMFPSNFHFILYKTFIVKSVFGIFHSPSFFSIHHNSSFTSQINMLSATQATFLLSLKSAI